MKLWETFDLTSLLVGLLIGGVVAFLLRLNALKRLSLDIKKIGLNLGVEGFEEPSRGFQISGNVGGDVAGRDMNKTDRSRNLYNTLQALAADRRIKIRRPERIQAKTEDTRFGQSLQSLQREGGEWFPRWIDACLSRTEIRQQIDRRITEIQDDGWSVTSMTFDNIPGGVHVNFDVEKPYSRT
jgi:hypothetical protein